MTERRSLRSRRAFSMVEMVVVLVILGILAAAVIPRLVSMTERQTRADAEAIAELLSIAGRRDDTTSQRVAIDYDEARGSVRLLVKRAGTADWSPDPFASQAELKASRVTSAQADGVELGSGHWFVEFPPASRRPGITIVLSGTKPGDQWNIALAASSSRASVTSAAASVAGDGSIDLDAAGRGEQAW